MAPPALQTLAQVETALWQELTRAPHDKHHEWRTAVLATVDGDVADARTVVLREVDSTARTLMFFSDARAAKVTQLQQQPLGTLVMWSRRLSWQLRLRVQLQAQTEGLAVASRWARLKLSPAAQDYLAPLPPGSPIGNAAVSAPMPAPQRESREHFAVLTASVVSIDWLALQAPTHQRARFDADGARWLVP